MSLTISTPQQINQSPLNASKSKQLWSFPKEGRFKDIGTRSLCQQAFYDLPQTKSQRKAGFGYGEKYDFTKQNVNVPAPNNYNIKSEFEIKHGISFGLGRENVKNSGIFNDITKSPGPGSYKIPGSLSTISFTMRPRTLNLEEKEKKVPGVGQYSLLPLIDPKGHYYESKYENSKCAFINPPNSNRFQSVSTLKTPGPGNYEIKDQIDGKGQYPLSRNKNQLGKSFPHTIRKTFEQNTKTPGVGQYRLPSEFGYYESSKKSQ